MIAIPTLLGDIVARLRDIPELVSDLGHDLESIQYHADPAYQFRNVEEAIDNMQAPSALVVHVGSELPNDGPWIHKFGILFKAETPAEYWNLLSHTIDGGPCKWVETDVNDSCEPPSDVEIGKELNADSVEIYRISFSVRERLW